MIDEINEILRNDVEVVIKSPQLSLSLLKCYSLLYIGGKAPGTCARSQRNYYRQLLKDGIMKAELAEKIKARTCKPAWEGVIYPRKACKHYSDALIHDEDAIDALKKGYLTESQFLVLPEGYKTKAVEEVIEKVDEVKKTKKKRGPKHKKA